MENKPLKLYFANSLFNYADYLYNEEVVKYIRETYGDKVDVYLPQEQGINDKDSYADSQMIANADLDNLQDSDVLIANLDTQDFGVGVEMGYAYALGTPMIGVYTDSRQKGTDNEKKIKALREEVAESQFSYINLMGPGVVKNRGKMVTTVKELVEVIGEFIEAFD